MNTLTHSQDGWTNAGTSPLYWELGRGFYGGAVGGSMYVLQIQHTYSLRTVTSVKVLGLGPCGYDILGYSIVVRVRDNTNHEYSVSSGHMMAAGAPFSVILVPSVTANINRVQVVINRDPFNNAMYKHLQSPTYIQDVILYPVS